jgi:hypothetical protein
VTADIAARIIEEGKRLDPDMRAIVAGSLVEVREAGQAGIDGDWDETAARRAGEVLDGTAVLVDGRQGMATIRAELAARRA